MQTTNIAAVVQRRNSREGLVTIRRISKTLKLVQVPFMIRYLFPVVSTVRKGKYITAAIIPSVNETFQLYADECIKLIKCIKIENGLDSTGTMLFMNPPPN